MANPSTPLTPSTPVPSPAPVTLDELARHLSLAVGTVSRALNGNSRVTLATRLRVSAAAKKLGYQPSPLARGLRMGRSGLVGICFYMNSPSRNVLISQQLYFLQKHLQVADKRSLVEFSAWDYSSKLQTLEHFSAMRAEGIVHVGSFPPELLDSLEQLRGRGIPYVLINPGRSDLPYSISLDRTAAYEKITDHLLDLGHRRFLLLGITPENVLYNARIEGVRRSLARRGLCFEEAVTICFTLPEANETSGDFGYRLAQFFYPDLCQVTACLASNDDVAAGAMAFLKGKGIDIPRQLSMVGFDNTTAYISPALSTVEQEIEKTAKTAVQTLFARLAPEKAAPILIEPQFIVRDSTAPAFVPEKVV